MKRKTTLLFLTFILGTTQLCAQGINPYLIFGSNLTEARLTESGKSQVGFRMGLNIGVGASMRIGERLEMTTEFLYSKNGLYGNFVQLPAIALDKITLQFFEVPLTLAYDLDIFNSNTENFNRQTISGGLTFARLFKHKIIAVDDTDVTNDVDFDQENTLLFNIGTTTFLNESYALNGKVTVSTFGKYTYALRMLYYI